MFQYPKNTQKHQPKTGAGLKKQYTISSPKKNFFAPALTRQGERLWLRQSHRSGAN